MIMAGDDEKLGGQVLPDIGEMIHGIVGGDEVSVLLLADMLGQGAAIFEVTPKGPIELASRASLDTGDPRPLSSFLAIGLSSFSKETRIALGFWGHGSGVFGDLDPHENLIPDALMELPLGKRITETMFLENYLAEPMPIKSLFTRGMLPDASTGGILTNRELSSALAVAFSRAGRTEPVDMMFFDTCQNGAVEVYAEMRRYCKTFVASCLVVPGMGWNYTWFLQMTRQGLPRTAADWAKHAIAAFDKTYDQSLYPTPVQLVAIDSNADFLEKLQVIAQRLKEMDPATRAELMQCSQHLDAVAHDESVDMCSLILALKETTTDDALVAACDDFRKAYSDSVIAISAPANDGKAYHGLSLWCPRMGDAVSVSKYYQNLRFHKETGWFDVIKEMVKDEAPRRADPIFMILSFQGLELLEAREVKTTVLDPDDHGMHHLLLSIPEKSKRVSQKVWNFARVTSGRTRSCQHTQRSWLHVTESRNSALPSGATLRIGAPTLAAGSGLGPGVVRQ